jgi:hypothetical protein
MGEAYHFNLLCVIETILDVLHRLMIECWG